MSPKKSNFELKVGIFVVLSLIILMVIVLRIEDFSFFKKGYTMHVIFNYVSALDVGAPVDLSGVAAGEVKYMEIFYNENLAKTQVDVTVWMKEGITIRKNSIARIKTLGLLGEKYIELTPGYIENDILVEGDVLFGQDPIEMEDLMETVNRASEDLDQTIVSINSVIGDYNFRQALKQSVINFEQASSRIDSVLTKIDEAQGTIGRLIGEDKIYRDLEELVADLKRNPWKLLHKTKEKEAEKTSLEEKGSSSGKESKKESVFF
ncbi:MAG: MlaD family protein [Candidatus Omnitrophota bacterium]